MQLRTTYILLLLLFTSKSGTAQTNELYLLDSTAFAALESNAPDVEDRARALLEAGQKANAPLYQINAYTLLGIVNKNKGYYVTSVDFHKKALEAAQTTNDQGRISACYNNIGTVYKIQENYPIALSYFKQSLELEGQLDNPLQKSIRLYNIGDMYREMDSLSLALTNFNSSLLIEKEHGNEEGIVYALSGITDVYLRLDRLTDAKLTLEEIEQYSRSPEPEIQILQNLLYADLYYKQGKYDAALEVLKHAKQISRRYNLKVHMTNILEKEVEVKEAADLIIKKDPENNDSTSSYWIVIIGIVAGLIIYRIIQPLAKQHGTKDVRTTEEPDHHSTQAPTFQLKNDSGKVLLEVSRASIICFEANDNYVITYYLSEQNELQKSMERASLKKVEEIIGDDPSFFRVHKSHVINKNYVDSVSGKAQAYKIQMQFVSNSIPVSRSFDISKISS